MFVSCFIHDLPTGDSFFGHRFDVDDRGGVDEMDSLGDMFGDAFGDMFGGSFQFEQHTMHGKP